MATHARDIHRTAYMSTGLVLAVLGGCSDSYADWDAKVKELCQKDGGVVVYERVQLSADEARRLTGPAGGLLIPRKESADPGVPYVSETKRTTLNEGNPTVLKWETVIVRTSDGKVLSRLTGYGRVRRGGIDSGYSCRDLGIAFDVERETFTLPQ